jgi:hypothetical protein
MNGSMAEFLGDRTREENMKMGSFENNFEQDEPSAYADDQDLNSSDDDAFKEMRQRRGKNDQGPGSWRA